MATTAQERTRRAWRCLAALTLARAAMGFQFQSVAAVAPLMAGALGVDKTQLGWLVGLYMLPGVAFALPGGLLGRRFGDKRLVLVGLALMAAGGVWLAVAGSLAAADAARFASGIGGVMINVLMTKMVTDLFEGKGRLLAMSVLINAWPIGIGLALLAIGPLAEHAGWRWGVASTAAFAVLGVAIVWAAYRPPAPRGPSADAAHVGLGVLSRREWWLLAVGSLPWLLYNAAYQITTAFLPSILVADGLGIVRAGSLLAINTVGFVVGVQAGGFLLKRASRPDLVCHLMIAAWCATLLFIAAGSEPLPWLVIGGLLGGVPAAALVSVPGDFLRAESRHAGMGVFYTAYYLGCALVPPLAGALYDRAGGEAALWMAAAIGAGTAVTLAMSRRAMAARVPTAVTATRA